MMRTITPILSFVIAILLFAFFVSPQYDKIEALKQQIAEYDKSTADFNSFVRTVEEKLQVKRGRSIYENERLTALVPLVADDTRLLVDLDALTRRHNMLFGNIKLSEHEVELVSDVDEGEATESTIPELQTIDISFEVIGTYKQLKLFLQDLERSLTLLDITELSFAASEGDFMQFSITLRTYALPIDPS